MFYVDFIPPPPKKRLIDYLGFYAVSAIFQPCNGGDYLVNDRLSPQKKDKHRMI